MSAYASPAPSDSNNEPKKITFRFCEDCSNLLYPRENKENNTLQFACRTCSYETEAQSSCIYRNELSNTAAETAGVTSDLGQDPTVNMDLELLADVPSFCTMCGQEIFCGMCGQETKDAGLFIEADDEEPGVLHASRPPREVHMADAVLADHRYFDLDEDYDVDDDDDDDDDDNLDLTAPPCHHFQEHPQP
ncbi:hypothetical protein IWZ03DRAFT_312394 [Phyllosticta citriasiana]|uniref:DNA-directed RNA polymerase II subunit RPB9-like zinc ribbon domain-containing protein n=2 Tax=Phyllosticta TaxID=121621 RepID=A0ABR1KL27_9PEZI